VLGNADERIPLLPLRLVNLARSGWAEHQRGPCRWSVDRISDLDLHTPLFDSAQVNPDTPLKRLIDVRQYYGNNSPVSIIRALPMLHPELVLSRYVQIHIAAALPYGDNCQPV
jgi:hypothetical protein